MNRNVKIIGITQFFLILLTLLPLMSLLRPGLPVTHDGQDHVARIANFYQSLIEGNSIPRWAGNLNWGYGHPILMFLYPLPSYLGSIFHRIGFSLVDSTKLVFAFGFVVSVYMMYRWARVQFGEVGGVVSGVLYGFAPYRFVDLYVRGAIGEHTAFIFPPVIMWGILDIARKKNSKMSATAIVLGTSGLILSHNALSIIFFPLIFLYAIYAYKTEAKEKKLFFITVVGSTIMGFLLAAFFWIPALVEGKYTLRDIVTRDSITSFVSWSSFFVSSWNYGGGNEFTKSIGLSQTVGVIVSLWLIIRTGMRKNISILFLMILFFVSLIMMMSVSETLWKNITLIQKFQFPWRILSATVLLLATLAGAVIQKTDRYKHTIAILFIVIAIMDTMRMWQPKQYKEYPESFFTGIYNSTTDTGESSPVWSTRFMEHRYGQPLEFIEGEGSIEQIRRTSTIHEYQVTIDRTSELLENTLYFPNWRVFVDDKPVIIEYQNPTYRGLLTFEVPSGLHTVKVVFEDTKLRSFARILTVLGIGSVVLFLATIPLWSRLPIFQ